jgi:hypothetical protein
VWQIWRYRGWLGTHVDMIVLICGYGGLGMKPGAPHCHDTAQGWFEMTAGMLALGLVPVFFGSRCFAAVRRTWEAPAVLLFDTLGMMLGMGAMHLEMSFISPSPVVKHFVMVFGMAAGMIAGSVAGAAYSKRSRRKDLNIRYPTTITRFLRESVENKAASSLGDLAAVAVALAPVLLALLLLSYLWSR